jgi:hypothetical protein
MRINSNEYNPSLRTIPVYLYTATRQPFTGAVPLGGQLQVSLGGNAWTNALGTWAELSGGLYNYQATQAETNANGFIWIKAIVPGAETVQFVVQLSNHILVMEPNPLRRRIPIYLTNASNVPVVNLTLTGASQVQISKNGSPAVDAIGAVQEIGGAGNGQGGYYYEATAADIATAGYCAIKVFPTGLPQTRYVYTIDVISPSLPAAVTFRMRARDETLNTTVFWSSTTIDATGSFYAGPGPITDIVIQNIEC